MDNKKKNPNVPNLRFTEDFGYLWKTLKIIDVAPLQRGFDLPEKDLKLGIYPVVYSNGIKNYHNQYKAIAPGIVTGRSGTIGKFTYIDNGGYWPHNTSLWVTDFKSNYPKFVYYLFQFVNFNNYSSGSGVPTLNRNDIHDRKVSIPPLNEQIKIATFLDLIEKRIDTQIKIIEDLKVVKEQISNQLFKLEMIYNSSYTLNDFLVEGDKTPVQTDKYRKITIKLNKQGIIFSETNREMADTRPFYKRYENELIIGKQNYFNGSIALITKEFDSCICSNAIMSFKINNINKDFLYYQISNNNYLNSQAYKANGTGQKELSEREFLKFKVWVPTNNVQKEIVKCFKSLELKITNEILLLSNYTLMKKYLLENMFI